jgi:amidase
MRVIRRDQTTSVYDSHGPTAGSVAPGERFLIEAPRGSRTPTGPIEVVGANRGDVLAVEVVDIVLVGDGQVWARPGAGMLGETLYDLIDDVVVHDIPIRDGHAHFGDGIELDLRPMVGVVGVSPPGPAIPTTWPGRFGGNLDCNLIRPGSTVYLPVFNRGADLCIGDVHARMGSGEVMTSGLEIESDITVQLAVHPKISIKGPIVDTPEVVAYLASAKSLELAGTIALERAVRAVQGKTGYDYVKAGLLLSLIGELIVVQAVNARVTVAMVIRKDDLGLEVLRHAA